jgi:hypothetical protein
MADGIKLENTDGHHALYAAGEGKLDKNILRSQRL